MGGNDGPVQPKMNKRSCRSASPGLHDLWSPLYTTFLSSKVNMRIAIVYTKSRTELTSCSPSGSVLPLEGSPFPYSDLWLLVGKMLETLIAGVIQWDPVVIDSSGPHHHFSEGEEETEMNRC
ncbi:hypothetical protein MJG53_006804 [Ovis ammon polii x Ovis aries]|uniref:Uncharacterized protein n=1 Tax=Ovis ammon polii x Ovis aries TaxID=2918886 RepID=A0ACB9V767_9CETA|nr:hypothetical protein MJG53_006804 [Ovis ammon polii x Ovis aries]